MDEYFLYLTFGYLLQIHTYFFIMIDKFAISNTYLLQQFWHISIAWLLSGQGVSLRVGWNNKLQFEIIAFERFEKPQAHKYK